MKLVSVVHPVKQDTSKRNDEPGNASAEPRGKHAFEINNIERKLLRHLGNDISEKARQENQKVCKRQHKQEVRLIA